MTSEFSLKASIHIGKSHKPTANQNLPKSMSAPSHRLTEENKARAHNNVYKSLGSKWLIEA